MKLKLPTGYLPEKPRSAVRFLIIGTTGALLQTWFFMAALLMMSNPEKGTVLYYVAFGIGYALEMVPNYFLSNWYTFSVGHFPRMERRPHQPIRHLYRRVHQLSDLSGLF